MRQPEINVQAVCDEAVSHLSSLACIDAAIRHTYAIGSLSSDNPGLKQSNALGDIRNAMKDISTEDLTHDRLDLLAAIAFDSLGSTPTEQLVSSAIRGRLNERRERFVSRLSELSKPMVGKWFEIGIAADNIVKRSGASFFSPTPAPLYAGDILAIKPWLGRYEPGGAFLTHRNGTYALRGDAQRGSGASTVRVSLVNAAGEPQASIRPLGRRPKRLVKNRSELPY